MEETHDVTIRGNRLRHGAVFCDIEVHSPPTIS
jgi:hypothetical protein